MSEKEYIDREALINTCKKIIQERWNETAAPVSWSHAYADFIDDINNQPAADVALVKHGHWIYKKRTKLVSTGIAKVAEDRAAVIMKKHITVKIPYCSICGERGGDDKLDATPYCPDCGAKMDGDADANSNDNKTPET